MNDALKMSTRMLFPALVCLAVVLGFLFWGNRPGWTPREKAILERSDSVMYVTVLPRDSAILRTPSKDLGPRELRSAELQTLLKKMHRTLTDPSQDGVGIAAPQVGLNRRLALVQRFDKEGDPIEPYLDLHIDSLIGPVVLGPEGCLSVPPYRGEVPRYSAVRVSYLKADGTPFEETVEGYTAIIFQHECDHLDGILYIDRATQTTWDASWAQEREAFSYAPPSWWISVFREK